MPREQAIRAAGGRSAWRERAILAVGRPIRVVGRPIRVVEQLGSAGEWSVRAVEPDAVELIAVERRIRAIDEQ